MSFPQIYLWLSVGIVLLIIEGLGFTGFFLGMAIAALVTAAYVGIADPKTIWASIWLFAPLAVVLTWAYWHFFRGFNATTDSPGLNKRGKKMVGASFVLSEPASSTASGHFIGDTRWQVASQGDDLAAGTKVTITALRSADGVLIVEAAD